MCGRNNLPCSRCMKVGNMSPPSKSLSEITTINRDVVDPLNLPEPGRKYLTKPRKRGSLTLEVYVAIYEMSYAFKSMFVSEKLPRSPERLFVNVTSIENKTYCCELTFKGWRVWSLEEDCMDEDSTIDERFSYPRYSFNVLMSLLSTEFKNRLSIRLYGCVEDFYLF